MNDAAGVFALLDNAGRHHAAAELLVAEGFRGFAITHHILGAEESVKAWAALAQLAGYDVASSDFGRRDHGMRHELAAIESLMARVATEAALGLAAPTQAATTPEESREVLADLVIQLLETVRVEVTSAIEDESVRPSDMKWWDSANQLKNAGLYVDSVADGWATPGELDEEMYSSTARMTSEFSSRTAAALTPFAELANRDVERFRHVVRRVIVPVVQAGLSTL